MGYEYYMENKICEALNTFEIAEIKLIHAQEEDNLESFLERIIKPMFHIILSCKAHVLSNTGDFQKARDVGIM